MFVLASVRERHACDSMRVATVPGHAWRPAGYGGARGYLAPVDPLLWCRPLGACVKRMWSHPCTVRPNSPREEGRVRYLDLLLRLPLPPSGISSTSTRVFYVFVGAVLCR